MEYQKYMSRPIQVTAMSNSKIQQIACGANHTVALTIEGKVYFWGQYAYPIKQNEPPRYGRIG